MNPYLSLLRHSYQTMCADCYTRPESRLEYLSEHIFDFTTYDTSMSELFAEKAILVAEAINNKTTFEFIKDEDNHRWFLLMCNMPFFASKIEWGTSIRGAWWDYANPISLRSSGIWRDGEQLTDEMVFTHDSWTSFIEAMIEFVREH